MKHIASALSVIGMLISTAESRAETYIRTLPATLSKAGESYVLESSLAHTGSGPAITITASGVVLDGGGHTVRYCETSTACKGIEISGVSNTTIRNVSLQQGSTASGTATGIGGTSGSNTIIENVRFALVARPSGSTYGVNVKASGTGNEIRGSTFNVSGSDAIMTIENDGSAAWNVHGNTWNVTGLQYTRAYSRLINTGHNSRYYDNVISIDDKSRYVNVFVSWGQSNVKIYRNTIRFASHHGRIFHLDDSSSGFEINDNRVTVTSRNSGQDVVYVFRFRSDAGRRGSSNHNVHHNTIDASSSSAVVGISIGADTYANDNNAFSYNSISAPAPVDFYGDYASNTSFFCNRLVSIGSNDYPVSVYGSLHRGVRFDNNIITTNRSDGVKLRFRMAQATVGSWTFYDRDLSPAQVAGASAATSVVFSPTSLLGSPGCAQSAGARASGVPASVPSAPTLTVQ